MTSLRPKSGNPTPALACSSQQSLSARKQEIALMNHHSQNENTHCYSPLTCITLLLLVCAAAQLKLHAIWF
jgi:hypothetical protein